MRLRRCRSSRPEKAGRAAEGTKRRVGTTAVGHDEELRDRERLGN